MSETIPTEQVTQSQSNPMEGGATPIPEAIGTTPTATTDAPVPVLEPVEKKRRTRRKAGEPKAPKAAKEPKAPRAKKARGNANPGKSVSYKDWVRVKNSQRNDAPNERVHIVIDDVNLVMTIVTQAKLQEGSDELEPERTQRVKITSFEVVHGVVATEPVAAAEPAPVLPT